MKSRSGLGHVWRKRLGVLRPGELADLRYLKHRARLTPEQRAEGAIIIGGKAHYPSSTSLRRWMEAMLRGTWPATLPMDGTVVATMDWEGRTIAATYSPIAHPPTP